MTLTDDKTEQAPRGIGRNPIIGILAILFVGSVLMMITAEEESEPEIEPVVVESSEESVDEIPEISSWILAALDDFDLGDVADAGRLANEIRNAANYGPEFHRQNQADLDFSGEMLAGASFRYVELKRVDFSGADLEDALFGIAGMVNSNFRGACLLNARFALVDLSNADFTDAYLVGTVFEMTDTGSADFTGAIREGEEKCPEEISEGSVID